LSISENGESLCLSIMVSKALRQMGKPRDGREIY